VSRPGTPVLVWVGSAPPARSIRWLDGALALAAKLGPAVAVAAGDAAWLDLVAERATRAAVANAAIVTELELDYLGWAQVAAAAARKLGARTVIVDEASRPERFAQVAAIAELLDAVQLTRVTSLALEDDVVHATRVVGALVQTVRVTGAAVLGVRAAGPVVDVAQTPVPARAGQRFDLPAIGLDPAVLRHRALGPRGPGPSRSSVAQVADLLALYRTGERR